MFKPNEDDNVLASALGLAMTWFSGKYVLPSCSARLELTFLRYRAPSKRMSKRVMLITDNDDPFNGMMSYASPAQRKIKVSLASPSESRAVTDRRSTHRTSRTRSTNCSTSLSLPSRTSPSIWKSCME